jgi:phage FluMu gp28-like protein
MTAPAVLLGYQQRWIADKSPVRVIRKSRRIGLSWGQAAESALTAAAASGMDSWYIGYNKDMSQEFIRDVAFWAKNYNLAAGEIEEVAIDDEDKDILTFRITFASGKRVNALSSRPSNLRGKQGLIIIDDAAFHADLEGLIKAAMAMLIWGGRVCIISTHDGEDNPFNELCKAIEEGKLKYSLHTVTFDDALTDGLYKRICLKMGIDWTKEKELAWRKRSSILRRWSRRRAFLHPEQGKRPLFLERAA